MVESPTYSLFRSSYVASHILIRCAWMFWLVHHVARPQDVAIPPRYSSEDLGYRWKSREGNVYKEAHPPRLDEVDSP